MRLPLLLLCPLTDVPTPGHTKPLCALAAKIVRLRRAHATFFTDVTSLKSVLDEIDRQFVGDNEEQMKALIRSITHFLNNASHRGLIDSTQSRDIAVSSRSSPV